MPSRVLTVMFTDIKGFTERTSRSSRTELNEMLGEHEDLLMPLLPEFGGRLIKTVGDALLVVFESPTNAVLCGIMMQDRLRKRNAHHPEDNHLEIRVAINSGEVLEREGDVFGEAVNIAARIEGITEVSEIFFTESVYLSMNKAEVPSSEVGARRLKGIPEPIKIYRVIQDRHSEKYTKLLTRLQNETFKDVKVPTTSGTADRSRSRAALLLGGALAVGAVALAAVLILGNLGASPEKPPKTGETTDSPAPSPVPADPVLETAEGVRQAVKDGELGLALARAQSLLKDHSGRKESHEAYRVAVEAEVKALAEKRKTEEALKLIATREAAQEYMKFKDLRKRVLFDDAESWVNEGDFSKAVNSFVLLMRENPEDLEVLRAVVAGLAKSSYTGYRGMASSAAKRIAELTEGPLEEEVAKALVKSFYRSEPSNATMTENRKILAGRYDDGASLVRPLLVSDHFYTRMNAFTFLEETGLLTPKETMAVHVKNMVSLRSGQSREGKALLKSLAYLEKAGAEPGWEERKREAGVTRIEKLACMRYKNEGTLEAFRVVGKVFYPEVRASVLAWLKGEDLIQRHAGYLLLKQAGRLDEIDLWAYHAGNLTPPDYGYMYTSLHEAIAFFRGQAGTERKAEARALLVKTKETMVEHGRTKDIYERGMHRRLLDKNIQAVDEALQAFGPD